MTANIPHFRNAFRFHIANGIRPAGRPTDTMSSTEVNKNTLTRLIFGGEEIIERVSGPKVGRSISHP